MMVVPRSGTVSTRMLHSEGVPLPSSQEDASGCGSSSSTQIFAIYNLLWLLNNTGDDCHQFKARLAPIPATKHIAPDCNPHAAVPQVSHLQPGYH